MDNKKTLIVLIGPTGVGKTDLSIKIAEKYGSPIISADSRQLYSDLKIGTAAPTEEYLKRVKHYFVGTLKLTDYYSAAQYESEVISLLEDLFKRNNTILLTGGSMMYIDAVCDGIDDIPTVRPEIREELYRQYQEEGLAPILEELRRADPKHYGEVDRNNYKRVIHAVEICRQTGRPYSSFRTNRKKERPFNIIKVGLFREREDLYNPINLRVNQMMDDGLLAEAQAVYPYRHLNALNTVGYKELFKYLDGEWNLDFAVEKIKRNTRVYARKQMTWFKRDNRIHWFHPEDEDEIMAFLKEKLI